MSNDFYGGHGRRPISGPAELPQTPLDRDTRPEGYKPDPGLVDAVNVALRLGLPLLVTGAPGTGKTQLAYAVAHELGFEPPLKFETKSTSVARDLFYTYDTVGRFAAAQLGEGTTAAAAYITFNALGRAILRAADPDQVRDLVASMEQAEAPRRSVVLIDEVDKAPLDFPNDILNEIEGMYFRIPELGNRVVRADPHLRPIVFLTSNSEKNLPLAFLRRCAFYDIAFPDPDRLRQIVLTRLAEEHLPETLLEQALEIFTGLHDDHGITKKPSTGEFMAWIRALKDAAPDGDLRASAAGVRTTLGVLVKSREDRERAQELLGEWAARPR